MLLIETSGAFCTQAMAAIEKETSWHPLVIMSFTCASLNQYFQPLVDQGFTGKDTYLMQSLKDSNDPANANDPFIELYHDTLTAQGLDPKVSSYFTGWVYAWFMVDILEKAARYQGGLDRGNILLVARNIHENNPAPMMGSRRSPRERRTPTSPKADGWSSTPSPTRRRSVSWCRIHRDLPIHPRLGGVGAADATAAVGLARCES